MPVSSENPLLSSWFLSTVSFVSYNLLSAVSILVPIAPEAPSEQVISRGILRGTGQLAVIFLCILLPLLLFRPMLQGSELPMLTLAQALHPAAGVLYGILLFGGIFGAALSCLFGVTYRIGQARIPHLSGWKLTAGLSLLAFAASCAGFQELVSTFFPICGYLGLFAMAGIVLHGVRLFSKGKKNASHS